MKRFTPTFYANNIFEINPECYLKINTPILLLDLDNTLDSYTTTNPSDRVINYIKELKKHNIRPIIVSNNTSDHVKNYARVLEIECLTKVYKPFKRILIKKLKELNIPLDKCVMIGDQLLTDIRCANRLKIKSILLEPFTKNEFFVTKFNRLIDKCLRARLKKCGKLISIKEVL